MLATLKLRSIELVNNPTARVVFILGSLLVAALAGAAPHDLGGSG
jgi:hypothetical protein